MVSKKTNAGLNQIYPRETAALNFDAASNTNIRSPKDVKYHSETHMIKTVMMKQSKGFKGDLKPEHKKTTNRTTMIPITDFDSQTSNI